MLLPKLVFANFKTRKTRVALTIAAIAMSVSLVVSVTSGYTSIEAAAYKFFTRWLGSTDAVLANNNYGGGIPETFIGQLQNDPRVKTVNARLNSEVNLTTAAPARWAELIGLRMPEDTQVDRMWFESGGWFSSSDGRFIVIDQGAAKALNAAVGSEVTLPDFNDHDFKVKVVGIVHKPDVMSNFRPTIYMPLHTLEAFKGTPGQVSKINLELKNHSMAEQFVADWRPKLQAIDPNLTLRSAGESRQMLEQNLRVVSLLSYMGGLISMITATFIVFSTLSMGVSERQRTLAMLRAVGALRGQIAWLVIFEGLTLAFVGAAVGVGLGTLWVFLLVLKFQKLFYAGLVMSRGGIAFGVLGSMGAALAASLLPAWTASRVSPLEAMAPLAASPKTRVPWVCGLVGLLLIGIDPLILYGPTPQIIGWFHVASPLGVIRIVKFYSHFVIGLPAILVGFFLISPMIVWIVERACGPIVASMMNVKPALLRQQLSAGIWRAAGTATALMVGLAILVALQTEGRTAINGWKLPDKFPDMFIVDFSGISLADAPKLQQIPGVKKGEVMPIAIVSPGLPKSYLSVFGQETGTLTALMMAPDRTMFIGVDPNVAFKMIELDFRQGNVQDAQRMLAMGDHVLVTEEFHRLKGINLGDKLPLQTDQGFKDFTIAGVVWSPGIDVIVTAFDMGRQMEQRTAASVFGTVSDAQKYFGLKKFILFAADLDANADRDAVVKRAQLALRSEGLRSGDVRKIKNEIDDDLKNFLLLISTVAFAAMAVAAVGVANTILASIRTRQWQFGILRSIGVTRWQLLRLVLTEALLLGGVGCALGVPAGLLLSVDAEAVQDALLGYAPALYVPWGYVLLGIGIILTLSTLAALWPAILVARTETLELLQAGRAAA